MTATRRLAAILAADVAGYSRLIGADEEGTLNRLRSIRAELIDPKITEYRGRVVKTTEDGVLAEFTSVVDALRCATQIQRGVADGNAGIVAEKRIEFRVGMHQGDVVAEDGDIFGDGVNVAARLEGLADPGGICVSSRVQEDAAGRLDIAFDDLGKQNLKNIARPVHVYRVRLEGVKSRSTVKPVDAAPVLPLPNKPSIAVLPFANLSGDPEQEYFADGMVEEIITALSRIRWLFVIARNSSFTYKGQAVDVKQIGRELGVRYVLEGSVRKAGDRVRITAPLIDALSGTHLWADRFEGSLQDVFELQDNVASNVAGVMEPTLRQAEIEHARRKRPDSLDAYDLHLRALPFAFTAMPETAEKALPMLERAVAIEPEYGAAHAFIAWCYENKYLRGRHDAEARLAAIRHARIAIATGSDDSMALAISAFIIGIFEQDYETAFNTFDRSFALNPSSALAFGFSSLIRAWNGDSATAVEHALRALRLSPFDPMSYNPYNGLAYAHFFSGRFDEAASAASMASQANPRFSIPWILRAAALARNGQINQSKFAAQRVLDLEPNFTINSYLAGNFTSQERLAMLGDALRQSSLP